MNHMILYRVLCEAHASIVGGAVPTRMIFSDSALSGVSRSTKYKYLNDLIDAGFVYRVRHGWYRPVNIYQWHMDDYLARSND